MNGQDKWSQYEVKDTSKWEQYATPEITRRQIATSPFETARDVGIGAGALGLAGYGAYRYFKPALEARKLGKEIRATQRAEGIQGTELGYVPKYYQQKLQLAKTQRTEELSTLRNTTKASLNLLKKTVEDMDNVVISPKIEEIATVAKVAYPKFLKSASDAYKIGMEAIEGFLTDKNITFPDVDFERDVIDKVISRADQAGLLPEKTANLRQVKETIAPKFTKEGIAKFKPIKFSQAKGYVSSVINRDPYSPVSGMLREAWGNFLETNPQLSQYPEVKSELSVLNKYYKPVTEARTAFNKIVKSKTGEYDKSDLYRYYWRYIKARETADAEALMGLISSGGNMAEAQPQVSMTFKQLQKLKIQRQQLINKYPQLQQTAFAKEQDIAFQASRNIANLSRLRNKAEELESKHSAALSRMWGRIPTNWVGRLLLKGVIPTLGVTTQIGQAYQYAQDPEAWQYSQLSGGIGELAPQGSQERRMQLYGASRGKYWKAGQLSPEQLFYEGGGT